MTKFIVAALLLIIPSLLLCDPCSSGIEGVNDQSTMEEVIAAWSSSGLQRVANARPTLIRSKANRRGPAPDVDVVAFGPSANNAKLTGLLHLRWERYNDRGVLKIKAQYRPDMPRENGIAQQMEKWSLWPMIAERKKQCVGAADIRDPSATLSCQDKPGHLVVSRLERAFVIERPQPQRVRDSTEYACTYQFNAGPGASITEEITVDLKNG